MTKNIFIPSHSFSRTASTGGFSWISAGSLHAIIESVGRAAVSNEGDERDPLQLLVDGKNRVLHSIVPGDPTVTQRV